MKAGLDNSSYMSCEDLINWCGMKVDRHKGASNDKFSECLAAMQEHGYIMGFDKTLYKTKNILIPIYVNEDKFFPTSNYGIIYENELNFLREYKTRNTRVTNSTLLLLLSYFRCNIMNRSEFQSKTKKPEFCYRLLTQISTDLGLSTAVVKKSIDILRDLELIEHRSAPRYKDKNGNWRSNVTMFVNRKKYNFDGTICAEYDYQEELKHGEQYILKKSFSKKTTL